MTKKNSNYRGLYTLYNISDLGIEQPIKFITSDGKKREKLTLTEIDNFTTNFNGPEELFEELMWHAVPVEKPKFCIRYKNNHEIKEIEVAYSDNEMIKETAEENLGSYHVKGSVRQSQFIIYVITELPEHPDLMKFLRRNDYMSSILYSSIYSYVRYESYNYNAALEEKGVISKQLSEYKQLRDLVFGIEEYKKMQKKKAKKEAEQKVLRLSKPQQGTLFDPNQYNINND